MPIPAAPPVPERERRFSPRHYFHGPIAMTLANGQHVSAHGIDVGSNGLGLHCQFNLPGGTPCQLHFSLMLKDGSIHPLSVRGVVVHTTLSGEFGDFKVGVQLAGLDPATRDLLARYASQ